MVAWNKIHVDWSKLDDLILQGFNGRQIGEYYGYTSSTYFCLIARKHLGEYLSLYIKRKKNETKNF